MTTSFTKKQLSLAVACALVLGFASNAARAQMASAPEQSRAEVADRSLVTATGGQVWRNGFGECWHAGFGPAPLAAPSAIRSRLHSTSRRPRPSKRRPRPRISRPSWPRHRRCTKGELLTRMPCSPSTRRCCARRSRRAGFVHQQHQGCRFLYDPGNRAYRPPGFRQIQPDPFRGTRGSGEDLSGQRRNQCE